MPSRHVLATLLFFAALASGADTPRTVKLGGKTIQTLGETWVAISSDGKELAYRTGPDTISVFEPLTGKRLRDVRISQEGLGENLHYTADGRFAFRGMNGFRVVDATTGQVLIACEMRKFTTAHQLGWSDDGGVSAASEELNNRAQLPPVRVWNRKGEVAHELPYPSGSSQASHAVSGDGKVIATAIGNTKERKDDDLREYVTLWDAATGKETGRLHLGKGADAPLALSLNRDGRYLIVATSVSPVSLWDLKAGKKIAAPAIKGWPSRFTYSPDGRQVGVQSDRGSAVVIELATGKVVAEWDCPGRAPGGIGFTADGDFLACSAQEYKVTVVSLTKKDKEPPAPAYEGHTQPVLLVHWATDGKTLLTVGEDGKVFRWDTATGKLMERVIEVPDVRYSYWSTPLAVSPDGRWLIARQVGDVQLFDLMNKKQVATLNLKDKRHFMLWEGFAFSEDGKRVFAYGKAQVRSTFEATQLGAALCWRTDGTHEAETLDPANKKGEEVFAAKYGKEKLMKATTTGPRPVVTVGLSVRDPWASPSHPWPLSMGRQVTVKDADGKKVLFDAPLTLGSGGPVLSPDGKRIACPLADTGVVILDLPTAK